MFEYVEDHHLKFNGSLVPRGTTVRILLHHTGGGENETVESIHAFHLCRGHKGIDYNACVLRDGRAVWGRGPDACGGSVNNTNARTRGMNDTSCAVAALGDFEHEEMSHAQKEGLKRLVRDLAQYFGVREILGHNEAAGRDYTDCPGNNFPLGEVRTYALAAEPAEPAASPASEPEAFPPLGRLLQMGCEGEDVRQAQERLAFHHADCGGADGVFGRKTRAAVTAFQQARIDGGRGDEIGAADGIIGPKRGKYYGRDEFE